MLTSPTPESCEIFCASRVSTRSSTRARGKVFDVMASVITGASAGLDFAVNGWCRQAGRQEGLRGVDRRLHFLFGYVDVQVERELQGDDRATVGADGRHLIQSRHLAELSFERSSNGGSRHVRTRSRIKGDDLNRRIIHLWQGGNAELAVGDYAR